jgi:hypothetical protein
MCNYCNNLIFFVINRSENLKITSEFASEKCLFSDKSSILSPTMCDLKRSPDALCLDIPVIKPHNLNNALFLVHKIKNIALFLVHIDDIEYGHGISIPLWTFGLLY